MTSADWDSTQTGNRLGPLLAMIVTGIAGASMMIIMPGVLSALASIRGWSNSEVAILAATEMAGIGFGTFGSALIVARINRRALGCVALVVVIAAHLASAYSGELLAFLGSRFVAGSAEGVLIAVMTASIAGTMHPDRNFAIYMASNLAISTLLLTILRLFIGTGAPQFIFFVLCAIDAIALVLLQLLPGSPAAEREAPSGESLWHMSSVLGLLATLLLFIGIGATWPLVGQIGVVHGLPAKFIATALSVATFMGIVSGLIVSALGTNVGRSGPILIGTTFLMLGMLGLKFANGPVVFAFVVGSYLFFWVFIVPYYTGVMSALDPGGRMASFSMAMQFIGLTLGPLIVSPMLRGHSLSSAIWMGVAICPPAITMMLVAERRLRVAQLEQQVLTASREEGAA